MKTLIPLVIILVIAIGSSVSGGLFITEQADVLQKDEFLLKTGFFFSKFADIQEPVLYEENSTYFLRGALFRKEMLAFPLELKAGLTDNLTIGFSTSYIWNVLDMSVRGNSVITDGSYVLSTCGLPNLEFIGKYRIIKEGADIPGASFFIKVRFPLGDEDLFAEDKNFKFKLPLGTRGILLGIYEAVSKKLNFLTIHFNLGYEYTAPYSQRSDSLGNVLVQPRIIDPGDRLVYNFACVRDWEKISFVGELSGILTRDLRADGISIRNSGTHILDAIAGIQFCPVHNFSLDVGIRGTLLSNGGNNDSSFGPMINLSQRF